MRHLLPLLGMLLVMGCPPFIWPDQHREDMGEATHGEGTWHVLFWPELTAGVCGGSSWCCQTVSPDDDGQFEEIWDPYSSSALRVQGFVGEEGFEATLECYESEGPTGWIVADKVGSHYQGPFQFESSFGATMVVPYESDTVAIQGMVYDPWSQRNVQGARVTASVDPGSDAVTNEAGMFYLLTGADKEYGQTPYTLTIQAQGYETWQQEGIWGDQAVYLLIELLPSGEGGF